LNEALELYPIQENGLWGFIDNEGEIVIKPTLRYDHVSSLSDGVAFVNSGGYWKEESLIGGKWGLIDSDGDVVVEPVFDGIYRLEYGYFVVELYGKYGFIDRKGRFLIEPKFTSYPHFSDNVAWVYVGGEKVESVDIDELVDAPPKFHYEGEEVSLINSRLEMMIQPTSFDEVRDFDGGVAWVKTGGEKVKNQWGGYEYRGGKWGLINKKCVFLAKPQFDEAYDFEDGLARVKLSSRKRTASRESGKYGIIDRKGSILVKPTFAGLRPFSDGVAWFNPKGDILSRKGKWGLMNKRGHIIIKPRFDDVREFDDGIAWVRVGGKQGFINKRGVFVLGPTSNNLHELHHGAAWIYVEGKYLHEYSRDGGPPKQQGRYGLIRKDGEYIVEPAFDNVGEFYKGKALVELDHKRGLINTSGQFIIKPEFNEIRPTSNANTLVRLDKKWGLIDESGNIIVKPEYDNVIPFSKDLTWVYTGSTGEWLQAPTGGKWGLLNKKGQFIIEPSFDRVEHFRDMMKVHIELRWGYVNGKGRLVWMQKIRA
jgi:hypothetical protein